MSTKSKNRKNHKQKVAARNLRISHEKRRTEKMQREFIMNLIKQEQEKGLYDNTTPVGTGGPIIDGPIVGGPMIDGPMIDGPMIDGPIMSGPMMVEPIIDGSVFEESGSDNIEQKEIE